MIYAFYPIKQQTMIMFSFTLQTFQLEALTTFSNHQRPIQRLCGWARWVSCHYWGPSISTRPKFAWLQPASAGSNQSLLSSADQGSSVLTSILWTWDISDSVAQQILSARRNIQQGGGTSRRRLHTVYILFNSSKYRCDN